MTTYDRHGQPILTEDDLNALDQSARREALAQAGPEPDKDSSEWCPWHDAYWKARADYLREALEGREIEQ